MAAVEEGRVNLPRNQRIKDGRLFEVSKRARSGEIYLRCSTKFCFGTAKKLRNGDIVSLRTHSDNCFADNDVQLKADFKEALKNALERNFWKLKQLYETVASMFPREIKIAVPYNEIVSSLKRWRKRFYPSCPESLQSMADQLEQPENQRLLEYDLGKITAVKIYDWEENLHLLMYDPQLTAEFANVSHIFVDGTFQTTPRVRGVYQLVTVLGIKYDHAIPIAHILMSRKNECSYMAVLNSIKTTVINGQAVAVVMTDFEQALRNACRNTFSHAIVAGCSVHYDRAILKKVKALHLMPLIRQDEQGKLFLKKIMALAYLPASVIPDQYVALKNALSAPLQRSFGTFFRYYERQWLGKVKPTGFSVFRLSRRTNNVTESYNNVLKAKMGQHPSAWTFIGQLIKLTSNARDDVESLKMNMRIIRHPRYATVFRRRELTNAWNKLASQEITATEFLDLTAPLKGNIRQALMQLPEEVSGDETELEEGPQAVAPDADPDYDSLPREEMNDEPEPAFNNGSGVANIVSWSSTEPETDDEYGLEEGEMNASLGSALASEDGLLDAMPPSPSPPTNLPETAVGTINGLGAGELNASLESAHAPEDGMLDSMRPSPSPPRNLPETSGIIPVSNSRKRNLRKKRRR